MNPIAWYCPVCKKFDLADAKEPMAKPEHIPYRGVDVGSCKGVMIPLYDCSVCPDNPENHYCPICRQEAKEKRNGKNTRKRGIIFNRS